MDTLTKLKDKLNIDENEFVEIEEVISHIEETLTSYGISFDEQLELGFYSHVVSFIRRLKENEKVMDVSDNSILEQIDKKAVDIAEVLVKPIFKEYNSSYNYSEVILIAVYIQTAMFEAKGGEGDE